VDFFFVFLQRHPHTFQAY
jgi:hypothetical protein